MSISRTKINNLKIAPLKTGGSVAKPVKGKEIIDIAYPNIFLLAKKFSGKTVTIGNMLPRMAGKRTNIIVISSTVDKDANWKAIVEDLSERFTVLTFSSIVDDNGVNVIDDLMSMIDANVSAYEDWKAEGPEYEERPVKFDRGRLMKKPKPEYEPIDGQIFTDWNPREEYLLVLDDVSNELKNRTLEKMMKKNRHYKIRLIISSQHYSDLPLGARKNVDLFLLFPLINNGILKNIYESTGCPYTFDDFEDLYLAATAPEVEGEKSYNFMYYNVATAETRKNFNEKLEIEE